MKAKLTALILGVILLSVAVSAPPQPPHRVYGEITDEGGDLISGEPVEFRYDGSTLVENNTDSNGYYDVKIPYGSNYDGEQVSLFVDGDDTTESVTFESGNTTELNYNLDGTQDPHSVSGTITDDGEEVEDALVEFIYDSDVVADDETDSSGDYSVEIPYNSTYDGEDIEMHVEENDTGQTIQFSSGGSDDLDFEADWLINDSDTNTTDGGGAGGEDGSGEESGDGGGAGGAGQGDSSGEDQEGSDGDTASDISFTDMAAPEEAVVGENITIEITLENTGDETGDKIFTVEAGGRSIKDVSVTVDSGGTKTVKVNTSFEESGVYTITAGDLSADVTVEEGGGQSGSSLPFIPIGILMLVISVSAYLGRDSIKGLARSVLGGSEGEEEDFGWKYAKENNE